MLRFAINRLDLSGAAAFADSAARAEALGWHMGLLPCNPLKVADPYVCLALAAERTSRLELGTLLDTPVLRHPAVLAGSICTVAELAPGRVHAGLGIGDTAVRFNGLAPASVAALEACVAAARTLIRGDALEVGAAKPARLSHARPVPVWVAAQGPRALRVAGRVADGVWIRVGRDAGNLAMAWEAVCAGAVEAGRDPRELTVGLILHTALCDDAATARTIGKAIAAGYYEYSPFLFERPRLDWTGAAPDALRHDVYPDFLHHRDPERAGRVVDFLAPEAADAFALHGNWQAIRDQLERTLADLPFPVHYLLPHPVLPLGATTDFLAEAATHLVEAFA